MKAIWIGVLVPVALVVGHVPPAVAQSFNVPFTCSLDMGQLGEVPPEEIRNKTFLTQGEKKCAGGRSKVIQIRCAKVVDWPNPRNRTIKTFDEPCQFFGDQCGTPGVRTANNQTFKIRRIDSDTAELELFCVSNRP
jgi:hypothetical protein